ncbi:MAG: class I SAM-dependent methyltransferase [Chloroflexota bacterium]
MKLGVRRVPGLDANAPLPDSEPGLLARIVGEIRDAGPMTFARFMAIALYDPNAGYYTAGPGGPGRGGDFLTAPEGHPIFGWAIARHVEELWGRLGRPGRFVVREHGAGTGALGVALLDGLRRSGSALAQAVTYQAAEVSALRHDQLRAQFAAAGLDDRLEPLDDRPAACLVLANELLDALPVHLVEGGPGGELREVFVGLDPAGELVLQAGAPSTPALQARFDDEGIQLGTGQRAEICLEIDGWLTGAVAGLERGVLLVIDYGYPADELYERARGSTLGAYHRHRVHDDPLVAIGRQDLTAHVDLTAVERAATKAGLMPLGRTIQAQLLAGLGIGDLLVGLQGERGMDLERYLAAKSAVVRLLDPRATGRFAVLAFGRDLPAGPPLRGFAAGRAGPPA